MRPGEEGVVAELYFHCMRMQTPPGDANSYQIMRDLERGGVLVNEEPDGLNGVIHWRDDGLSFNIIFIGVLDPGKGLGKELFKAMKKIAKERGREMITAQVSSLDERAKAFYFKKLRFKKVNTLTMHDKRYPEWLVYEAMKAI